MKKTKKLLSLLTAAAITMSAFTGLVVHVNAEGEDGTTYTYTVPEADINLSSGEALIDSEEPEVTEELTATDELEETPTADDEEYEWGKVHYTQDYETATTVDWATSVGGRYDPILATQDDNQYLTVNQENAQRQNNGATLTSSAISYSGTKFAIEFDAKLMSSNDQAGTTLQVNTANGYLLSISQTGKSSSTWSVNGTETVELPSSASNTGEGMAVIEAVPWNHFTVAYNDGSTYITITAADGTEILPQTLVVADTAASGIKNMTFATSRYYADFAIDNVVIRNLNDGEVADTKFYTLTVNTTRYATMKVGSETLYADVNGKIEIPLLTSGTEIEYTLSKTGYKSQEGTVTVTEDMTLEKPLEVIEAGDGEKTIYFESDFGNANGAYITNAADRGSSMALGTVELPDLSTVTIAWNVDKAEEGQLTWVLRNAAGQDIVGLQGITSSGELKAFTGWSGNSGYNQYDDIDKGANIVTIADNYIGSMDVNFVIDNVNNTITVSCGNVSQSLPMIDGVDASTIASMAVGKYRQYATLTIDSVSVTEPDPNYMIITGDNQFAKVDGKTITREYRKTEMVITPTETFEWTVERASSITKQGATVTLTDVPAENTTAKLLEAVYDGIVLKSLTSSDINLTAGQTDVEVNADKGTIIMIWDSLNGMKPLAAPTVAQEYEVEFGNGETDITGISIADGVLTVTDEAKPGAVKITCTGSTGKSASLTVAIEDFANVTATVDGPVAYEAGQTGTYMITSLVDQYKDDVISEFEPSFESSDTSVITIDAATGVATAVAEGNANIIVTVGNPGQETRISVAVTVATYSVTVEATGDSTEVSVANIHADAAITGYQVTTATADGTLVKQTTVAKADVADNKITADTTGAAKVEVAPVYEAPTIASADVRYTFEVPADTYDITVTMSGDRADLYVNEQLVVNNMLQYASNPPYTEVMHDVVVNEGYAKMSTTDYTNGKSAANTTVSALKIVKSPSIVTRKTKIYVMGDSLVAKYYEDADTMTGWGQVLQNYISDDIEVVDIANSGADSIGIADTQLTRILASAQEGDYMVLESGYNDKGHNIGTDVLKDRITYMTNAAAAKGVKVVLVSPNASAHDYNDSVAWTSTMTEVAEELADKADYINLAKLSYNFLFAKYGEGYAANEDLRTIYNVYRTGENGLHSTVNAANCWAAIIASELSNLDNSIKITDYTYTFNDGTNDITVNAATIVPAE